jgi:hypothetical protein
MDTVYHGSPAGGLELIAPRGWIHGEAYVHAARDPALAALFMGDWNDFILNAAYGDDGALEVTERFPGALESIYQGRSGCLYALDGAGFTADQTGFAGEVVSRAAARVVSSRFFPDLYAQILEYARLGALRIRRWPDRHPDIPADDSDLVEEAVLIARREGNLRAVAYCKARHPHLLPRFAREGY